MIEGCLLAHERSFYEIHTRSNACICLRCINIEQLLVNILK